MKPSIPRLRAGEALFLFLLGGGAALIGDHSHVVTGTTGYTTDAVPFVWSSPIWFPLLVGLATVAIAELRLWLPNPRTDGTVRRAVAGVAAVLGSYVTTALIHTGPVVPTTMLIVAAATVIWCVLGDGPGAVCGVLAAVIGPAVEIVIARAGLFGYSPACSASRPGWSRCTSRSGWWSPRSANCWPRAVSASRRPPGGASGPDGAAAAAAAPAPAGCSSR